MISWHTDLSKPPPDCSKLEWEWLSYMGSLSERLHQVSGHTTVLKLLKAEWEPPYSDEVRVFSASNLSIPPDNWWTREIVHTYQQQTWVWGRTLIPAQTLEKTDLDVQTQQPIGHILFQDPSLTRSYIEFNLLSPHSVYYPKVQPFLGNSTELAWTRRSVFLYKSYPLLVVEIFLPVFFSYLKEHTAHV